MPSGSEDAFPCENQNTTEGISNPDNWLEKSAPDASPPATSASQKQAAEIIAVDVSKLLGARRDDVRKKLGNPKKELGSNTFFFVPATGCKALWVDFIDDKVASVTCSFGSGLSFARCLKRLGIDSTFRDQDVVRDERPWDPTDKVAIYKIAKDTPSDKSIQSVLRKPATGAAFTRYVIYFMVHKAKVPMADPTLGNAEPGDIDVTIGLD